MLPHRLIHLLRPRLSETRTHLRTFRARKAPLSNPGGPGSAESYLGGASSKGGGKPKWQDLVVPAAFTVGVTGGVFAGAMIWQYENMRTKAKSAWKTQREIIQRQMDNLRDSPIFEGIFGQEQHKKAGDWRAHINRYWNDLTPGQRVFVPICALNVAVFLGWRIPGLQPMMMRYFACAPNGRCLPLLLSAFSHYSFFHLAANMYVLHSFSTPMVAALGKEQFTAVYLSSAVISSFASCVFKVSTGSFGYSLGASGAILAILGLFGTIFPDSQMQIVFLPMLNFSAATAIKGLIAIDTVGLVARWKFFDHAAHLGGNLFGVWFAMYGNKLIWQNRDIVMKWWHENFRDGSGRQPPSPPPMI